MRQDKLIYFLSALFLCISSIYWSSGIPAFWGHWQRILSILGRNVSCSPTPGINSGFYLEHLKRPVSDVTGGRAEYATHCWSYGRRFCHRAMMVLACWELSVVQFHSSVPPSTLPGCPLCPSLGCCAHPQPGKYRKYIK